MRLTDKNLDPRALSPLNLAFIGDCVYSMLVRETLIAEANRPVSELHRECVRYVSAPAQTAAYDKIQSLLTEEEAAVFRRGRNAKVSHSPKSASQGEYHIATGMEALFGYLYLTEQNERMKELFAVIRDA